MNIKVAVHTVTHLPSYTITSKASRILGFVKRNLKHCPRTVKERAYQTLVRPKPEYSSPIWNPQHKTPTKKIEQVQRTAARFVLNKPYNRQNPTSVTTMLQQLNWPTLEDIRKASDLILMFKVVNSLVAVTVNYLPYKLPRYADCIRFITYHCRVNVYQHSFFPRIVIPGTDYQTPLSTFRAWMASNSLSSPYTGCKVLRNCTVYIRRCLLYLTLYIHVLNLSMRLASCKRKSNTLVEISAQRILTRNTIEVEVLPTCS